MTDQPNTANPLEDGPPRLPPQTALAWSEARVDDAQARGPFIALWRPEGITVAIGIGQEAAKELDVEAMRRDGIGLVRRQSGGGAVLLYEGVLCWEAWAGFEEIEKRSGEGSGIRTTYRTLCGPVTNALRTMGCDVFHAGICDISRACTDGTIRKMAGTAQLRRKDMALVHGSLLVCPDLELLAKYLRFPSVQPEYRANRSHRDFCTTLAEAAGIENGDGGNTVKLPGKAAFAVAAAAREDGWRVLVPPGHGHDVRADELARDKYNSTAWNWERKRPGC